MVVGDYQIDAQFPAKLRFLKGGDAAVHGDDQPHTLLMELMDGDGVQAVAFLQTAGDVGEAVRSVAAQKIGEQTGGGDAVHIVVTEYGDPLPLGHGQGDPAGSQVHIGHQKRIRQFAAAIQLPGGLLRGPEAPGGQYHSGQGRISSLDQRVYGRPIRVCHIPNSIFHLHTHPIITFSLYYIKNPPNAQ